MIVGNAYDFHIEKILFRMAQMYMKKCFFQNPDMSVKRRTKFLYKQIFETFSGYLRKILYKKY